MVTLRERNLKDGRISLVLDMYIQGNREVKSLKIYLLPDKGNPAIRAQNKENRRKAEIIRVKRENEIIDNNFGLPTLKQSGLKFLDYFKTVKETKRGSLGNYGNWDSAYKILCQYYNNKDVRLIDVTVQDLSDIREYILNVYKTKANKHLSQNAASSYFNKIRICLIQAFEEGILKMEIVKKVKSIKSGETRREFLVEEEIDRLIGIDSENPVIKSSFMFAIYSGLRFSDLIKLRWKDINYSEGTGYFINYQQQKTGSEEVHFIPNGALSFLEKDDDKNAKVFKGLKYSAWTNLKLREWMLKAQITKKITFHSARHTYATYLITKGVDFAVLSKMLGHKDLKTTQIYAKVIDSKRIEAAKVFDKK
ncbi:site-specific integrase [Pedobacter sp. N36a]|uniref:site-specific integrase n=1 Tax=Pedobacter sp. N36a TaxID=2767996 RepID=UPI0016573B2D|nr:site-specific integrase [Pedobacter sp. N36a]MBC8988402.1 site-specific integrase [Pedobacter sp. N36a]